MLISTSTSRFSDPNSCAGVKVANADPSPTPDEDRARAIVRWIERTLGGEVIGFERQGRWRPAWFVDVKVGANTKQLYVRGAREVSNGLSVLKREYAIHRLLEDGGIKVAHVYGEIAEADAYVMDKVPGRSDLRHADREQDRESVRRQLAREMAKMHKLDIEPFCEAGMPCPSTALDTTLAYYHEAENYPRPAKLPDPRHAFLVKWVERNARPAKTTPRFTACDAGQFMYDGPELTAMMDFEYAMLGDPLQDLAILRRRTTYEPMGDIPGLFAMYEEEIGETLDLEGLYYQTVISATAAVVGGKAVLESFLTTPSEDGDYVQYLNWVSNSTKQGFEGVAEVMGYKVPELTIPEPMTTLAQHSLAAAKATASGLDRSNSLRDYRRRTLMDNIRYLERVAAYGERFAQEYLDDAAAILGHRPYDIAQADAELEAHVFEAGPDEDERLFTLLCTDTLRRCFILAIPGSTYYVGLTGRVQPLE
jgi:aminoglycoside phosphotransferase (APT) family kinase protein